MTHPRGTGAGIAVLLLLGSAAAGHAVQAPDDVSCNGSRTSRWSAAGAQYRVTAKFGDDADNWLAALHGVAVNERGEIFVYDARTGTVYVLDDALRVKRRFGRLGGGPGELTSRPTEGGRYAATLIAATEAAVDISDPSGVKRFHPDGRFERSFASPSDRNRSPLSFNVRGLQGTASGVLLAYDALDPQTGRRRLQTWELKPNGPELRHELPLPTPPEVGGRFVKGGPRQASPLWAAYNGCIVVGDGASPWMLRLDLRTGRKDTLRLPAHEVPPYESNPRVRRMEELLRRRADLEVALDVAPTALWRYAQLRIDPDGHVWVNPWRDQKVQPPLDVFRIDPSGQVHRERVPAFPVAFGPPGVYYARGVNPDTDEVLVVRYARVPGRE